MSRAGQTNDKTPILPTGRPRVLVLDEELPWPANTGKRLRTLNLLTHLAESFEIRILVHAGGASAEAIDEINRRGMAVSTAPSAVPPKRGLLFPFRLLSSLASPWPYSVFSHRQPGFRRTLARLLEDQKFDLVHAEWTPYAVYLDAVPLPAVIAAHNVEYQIWDRMADAEPSRFRRAFIRLQARRMRDFERSAFSRAAIATAVSPQDQAAIQAFGCRRVELVPNGVDTDYFHPSAADPPEDRTLVFTGSMDWRPNQDAVRWFLDRVWPRLPRAAGFRFFVVGREPPAWLVEQARAVEGVEVTGTVDDVRSWVRRSSVFVVPLRSGGGSRLKILEAMALGRPVVSTTVGAEGLDVTTGKNLILVDEPADFARTLVDLCADGERRAVLSAAGLQLVEEHYRWGPIAGRQAALWKEALAERAAGFP